MSERVYEPSECGCGHWTWRLEWPCRTPPERLPKAVFDALEGGTLRHSERRDYPTREAALDALAAARAKAGGEGGGRAALLEACKAAAVHTVELAEAWERGALDEHDGKGGTRSNRNAAVVRMLLAAVARAESAP